MLDGQKIMHPKQVSKIMTFEAKNMKWEYNSDNSPTMAALQTEGVAYLWNLLAEHRVALLADEVGMGKTFQALGVAALLWRQRPNAKILIMAPNRDICAHWAREFETFSKEHYKNADNFVKGFLDGKPVPSVKQYFRLRELAEAIEDCDHQETSGNLYITTIHSLSGLTIGGDQGCDKKKEARKQAEKLRKKILNGLGEDGFDLVIVDEAHYLRNKNGSSQRVAAAKAFFGTPECSIGQRTLLLTATPSHTHLTDVSSILSYFVYMDAEALSAPVNELMNKYGLRRLRIMAGKDGSFTKYHYRSEIAVPCEFVDQPNAEIFFALYQRRLVHEFKIGDEKRRILYGYLEGFESVGSQVIETELDQINEDRYKDFNMALDTKLLSEMSNDYREKIGGSPDHPKYSKVVSQCTSSSLFDRAKNFPLHEDKHLVFVRRIPSVHELTKRVNEQYDEMFAKEICAAWAIKSSDPKFAAWKKQGWSREAFNAITNDDPNGYGGEEDSDADTGFEKNNNVENEDNSSYLRSRITDLFKTKRREPGGGPIPATDCSRFSLSLRKSTSIHAMFMEPAADYLKGGYEQYYEYEQGGKKRSDYTKFAYDKRMSDHKLSCENIEHEYVLKDTQYKRPIQTMWALVFEHLSTNDQETLQRWSKNHPDIAENFANYIKAGFLFASPVIIELYCWHTRYEQSLDQDKPHSNAERRYHGFYAYAKKRVAGSLLIKYFANALASFEKLCGKIIDHKANDYITSWSTLRTLSNPAWYASGASTNRQRLILGFNSPFYPNTLVATSVFQEGVNLHLQCRKVHHYGIAWTPGDNEQRVGRLDRLFGKVNELLYKGDTNPVSLEINYPYLAGSFDEDQVGSFIERKFAVEEKIDRCLQGDFDKSISIIRSGWQNYLRKPKQHIEYQNPYPAYFKLH